MSMPVVYRLLARLAVAALLLAPGAARADALESAIADAGDGAWLAYRTPLVAGAASPCCLDHERDGRRCRLDAPDWTDRRAGDPESTLHVYMQVRDGVVAQVRPYGAQCPVDPPATGVRWVESVDAPHALAVLARTAREATAGTASSAVAAMALHAEPSATRTLDALLREGPERVSRDAAFWLAHRRGEAGFDRVLARFASDADGDLRQHLVFCLSRSPSPRALPTLRGIATNDRDTAVRGDALLWLAKTGGAAERGFIERSARADPAEDTRRRAVFALAQLPEPDALAALDALVADTAAPRALRREALFWLAQSNHPTADRRLQDLLAPR